MEQISRIGMDTSKRFFQLHGVNAAEKVVLRKKLRRKEMVEFFEKLAPTADECSRRLAKIPGVGPIGAALLMMKTPAPELFRSGRQFAAWIGLTPKDHSTAGKVRLGAITRAGDEALRAVLVSGATAVIRHAVRCGGRASPWLLDLLKRKPPKLAAVALARISHGV